MFFRFAYYMICVVNMVCQKALILYYAINDTILSTKSLNLWMKCVHETVTNFIKNCYPYFKLWLNCCSLVTFVAGDRKQIDLQKKIKRRIELWKKIYGQDSKTICQCKNLMINFSSIDTFWCLRNETERIAYYFFLFLLLHWSNFVH